MAVTYSQNGVIVRNSSGSGNITMESVSSKPSYGIYVIDANGYIGNTFAGKSLPAYFAICNHDADYSSLGLGQVTIYPEVMETIGGKQYRTKRIGNLIWMLDNLMLNDAGITHGASGVPSTPASWYYNNDESTYGPSGKNYGYLYNGYAVGYIQSNKDTLVPGWKVPSNTDFENLSLAGGVTPWDADNSDKSLKSRSDWSTIAGTDDFCFGWKPWGWRNNSGDFANINMSGYLWSTSMYSSNFRYRCRLRDTDSTLSYSEENNKGAFSLRLVRDAT